MKEPVEIKDFPMRYAYPRTKAKCPICGSMDGCVPQPGYLRDYPLTMQDWRQIYEFVKYVQLPFLHNIANRAIQRKKEQNS